MAEVASQAALVAAWPKHESRVGAHPHSWRAVVVNNSEVPVYDVLLTFESPDRPDESPVHRVGVLPPGEAVAGYPTEWQDGTRDVYGDDTLTMGAGDVSVSVMFTDATGMVWERNGRGELSQVRGHDSMRFLGRPVWPTAISSN